MAEQASPILPSAYELVMIDEVDSVLAEASRRAANGADEGTLVWAQRQTHARTRCHAWDAPAGNLHCALIIRPDFDNESAQQLCAVAAIAAGSAIAEVVAPMTGMGLRWPGDLLVNELLAGQVQLAAAPCADNGQESSRENSDGKRWPWLIIGLSVNVAHHPENPEPEEFNSIHDSGESKDVTPLEVLELFTRHFLRWINIWAEDGFTPVHDEWMMRARDVGFPRALPFERGHYVGINRGIGGHGELLLDTGAAQPVTLSVAEYFALPMADDGA
ncbi:MAG: BirA family biotin operon repressor/biotin-[acetyl-CoA-carboxylase] ligase [Gammaproteobacteria bacterium]|jgi:BirA family biotin operon repressor/biotin-[acetyl-CoA-carboxylase] ligase